MFRLLLLLTDLIELGASVGDLLLSLIKCVLLDKESLSEDVERVRVSAERFLEELFGFGILFGKLCVVDAIAEALKHLFFLRGHRTPLLYGLLYRKYDANAQRRVGRRGDILSRIQLVDRFHATGHEIHQEVVAEGLGVVK